MAVAIGSVAVVSFRKDSRWYAWLSAGVATIAVVSVVDTVNLSTGGALASLAFMGFIIWMLVSAMVMVKSVARLVTSREPVDVRGRISESATVPLKRFDR